MSIAEKDIILCGHGSGTPSLKRMDQYLTTKYNQIASNGKHKGVVAVRRLKKLTDADRKKFHDTYKTIIGRNLYSIPLRLYCFTKYSDGKYYSDCSSSICLTFEKLGYDCKTRNEWGMYQQNTFENVPVKIKNGHITNPEILKVGDCILFAGDDPSKPLQIGHVEAVYEMPNPIYLTKEELTKRLQRFLNTYYLDIVQKVTDLPKLTETGKSGIKTYGSVVSVWKYMAKKYYGANIEIDGSVAFDSECKKAAIKMEDPAQLKKHATLCFIIQGMLGAKGFYHGDFNGQYDSETIDAVKRFQKYCGLSQTGRVGEKTWREIL